MLLIRSMGCACSSYSMPGDASQVRPNGRNIPKTDTNDAVQSRVRFGLRVSAAFVSVSSGGYCAASAGLEGGRDTHGEPEVRCRRNKLLEAPTC